MAERYPKRRLVGDARNSLCEVSLRQLNLRRWRTRGGHLEVASVGPFDEVFRAVYCRHTDTPRLEMHGGRLYWLIDAP